MLGAPRHQGQGEVERGQVAGLEVIDGPAQDRVLAILAHGEPGGEWVKRMALLPLDVIDM